MLLPLSIVALMCAGTPAVLTLLNLREFVPPPRTQQGRAAAESSSSDRPRVTLCIPARNEESGIAACLRAALLSAAVDLRILLVDDQSTDRTAAIAQALAEEDARLSLVQAPLLPPGWNGKQHACWVAANLARQQHPAAGSILCFLDADVRLQPDALARMAALLRKPGPGFQPVGLVSGFPLEQTGTTLEWLLLPLIHFVLLGYLPLAGLRRTALPGFAAGCGQFLMVRSDAYFAAGGHQAIRQTMHDGLLLPRLLRTHGYGTRLADLTGLATCRMYTSAAATWRGLAKNATEGMASPGAIVPFSFLLLVGQVLPIPLLAVSLVRVAHASNAGDGAALQQAQRAAMCAWAAVVLSFLPRLLALRRFRQRPASAALHPVGVATLLVLQWYALARKLLGRPAQWKARAYQAN